MLTVTDAARAKFTEVASHENRAGQDLRIRVHGGGTYRPGFELSFVGPGEAREDDRMVDAGAFRVYVDPESARFLEGATIDFVSTPAQSGFKIDAPAAGLPRPEGEVADRIRQVLTEQVNPGIAAHGGRVELAALEGKVAYLMFGGGCQGCGMANVTLKEGVEKALLAEIPELEGVRDVTDHAAGTNPYYR